MNVNCKACKCFTIDYTTQACNLNGNKSVKYCVVTLPRKPLWWVLTVSNFAQEAQERVLTGRNDTYLYVVVQPSGLVIEPHYQIILPAMPTGWVNSIQDIRTFYPLGQLAGVNSIQDIRSFYPLGHLAGVISMQDYYCHYICVCMCFSFSAWPL